MEDFAYTTNPEEIKYVYAAKLYIFVGSTKTGSTNDDPAVDLSFSGNDPKGVLKKIDPRPATGTFIKIDKFNEPRKTKNSNVENQCGIKEWRFEYDPSQPIIGDLLYNDDPDIKQQLRTGGNGINANTKTITITKKSNKTPTTLLVIRKFLIRKENILEIHFYPNVFIQPADEPEANNNVVRTPISIYPAIDANHTYCYIQYIRLLQDGTNTLLTHAEWKSLVYG
ncbi:MAG: hypothetical protein FD167_3460 [bacterium]|nr:MAG: hypothetical protein FD167_3460 [bacterium]